MKILWHGRYLHYKQPEKRSGEAMPGYNEILRSATVSRRLPRMTDLPNPADSQRIQSRQTLGYTCSQAHELLIWAIRSEQDSLSEGPLQALENLMAWMCFLAAATHNPTVLGNSQTWATGLPFHEYLPPFLNINGSKST